MKKKESKQQDMKRFYFQRRSGKQFVLVDLENEYTVDVSLYNFCFGVEISSMDIHLDLKEKLKNKDFIPCTEAMFIRAYDSAQSALSEKLKVYGKAQA